MRIMRAPAILGLTIAALPARSLLSPSMSTQIWRSQAESCSAKRLWCARFLSRRPHVSPTMRCTEQSTSRRARDSSGDRATWGLSLSSWVAGAASFSSTALHSSTSAGMGAWWNGGGALGGGGGKNGTVGGAEAGGAMDEGGDSDGPVDARVCTSSSRKADTPFPPAEMGLGLLAPKTSAPFAPWVWLSAVWGLYAVWLRRSPLLTKALTSGALALGGDMAAQYFEFQQQTGSGRKGPFLKDTRRLLAVAIDSILITGPALHALYGLLERVIPTAAGGFAPATWHLVIDTFVFDPMFITSFFCVTGMLESRSLKRDVLPALRREFWPTVHGSWVVSLVFCPLQFVTFRYLPLEFRVLSVNVCDIVWTSVLSYFSHKAPPEEGDSVPIKRGSGKGTSKAAKGTAANVAGGRNLKARHFYGDSGKGRRSDCASERLVRASV